MPLVAGSRIGSYEIVSPLGSGGMGEVYRARDTRLKREVAIKVLPDGFSEDAERLARFQREAEILATLNHPNIAAVYGLEKDGSLTGLVLELVDGETLSDLLARGSLSVSDALPIAGQIADALESAHEKGIVHRDLKPANIKITPEGKVKVLDFGLAKMLERDAAAPSLSVSPTVMSANPTYAGVILGTAAYMSPEQSRGKLVDRRTDIWAFGCVLFEMLTGRQAFEGETVTDLFASILKSEPNWAALPSSTPEPIQRLLRQCLQKEARRRLQHIGDARIAMEDAGDFPVVATAARDLEKISTIQPVRRSRVWIASTAALLVLLVAAISALILFYRSLETPRTVKFFVGPPERGAFSTGTGVDYTTPTVSPNGRLLAFTAKDSSGKTLLWVRPLDSLVPQAFSGTDDAVLPFWSPDSRSIAFFAQGKLKRVEVSGGPPQNLTDAPSPRGGTWNRDNVILFAPETNGVLYRVASAGGERAAVTKLSQGQNTHRSPSFLPDGRHFLYYALGTAELSGVFVGTLDSGESKRLVAADSAAVYSAAGDLLFLRQGILMRQHFDAGKLQTTGDPIPVAESIDAAQNVGAFSVSDNGVLAFRVGSGGEDVALTWLDRSGKLLEIVGAAGPYRGVDVSPDGKRIAVHRHESNGGDIWVFESSRGPMSRQTFDASRDNSSPVWSPDGKRIAFGAVRNGKWAIYNKVVNGGTEELLMEAETNSAPMSWSPDGKSLVLRIVGKTQADEWVLSLNDKKRTPLLQDPGNELRAQISPDGRWIAYESNETGRTEIYVKAFPSGESKRQISGNGAVAPRWSGDGRELFFLSNGARMTSVKITTTASTLDYSVPTELFETGLAPVNHSGGSFHFYAVSPDGKRFLIPRAQSAGATDAGAVPITVMVNWFATLK